MREGYMMRKLITLLATVAIGAPGFAQAQTKFQSVVVVDVTRKVATETACTDGTQVNTLEVLPDRIRKTSANGMSIDLFFAVPREPGRPTPLHPLTIASGVPNVDVTFTGEVTSDGIPNIKTANNKSLCAWRFKIL
jgi:hypothetical protein